MVWKRIRLPFLGCSFLKGEMLNFRSVFLTLAQTNSNFGPFTGPGPKKEMSCFHGGAARFREGDYEVVHFYERMKCRVFQKVYDSVRRHHTVLDLLYLFVCLS